MWCLQPLQISATYNILYARSPHKNGLSGDYKPVTNTTPNRSKIARARDGWVARLGDRSLTMIMAWFLPRYRGTVESGIRRRIFLQCAPKAPRSPFSQEIDLRVPRCLCFSVRRRRHDRLESKNHAMIIHLLFIRRVGRPIHL